MANAYVLMTAMPPTKGHLDLVRFASHVGERVEVIVCTQPGEPYIQERYEALESAFQGLDGVHLNRIHKALPQEPEDDPGFWDMWVGFLQMFGFKEGDFIVASEKYGITLAEKAEGVFIPYDPQRIINPAKATSIRHKPLQNFDQILPEFQPNLRRRITLFGAESVGKTTLSGDLARMHKGTWLPEWARPYLETVGAELSEEKMRNIWHGQRALQDSAEAIALRFDAPFIFQDTDLFSTIGYWRLLMTGEDGENYSHIPAALVSDAIRRSSDYYIIVSQADVPFEPDPLRYGGDQRETTDQYWVDICERYGLPYTVLVGKSYGDRLSYAYNLVENIFNNKAGLDYTRKGREYGN